MTAFESKLAAGFGRKKPILNREAGERIRFYGNREFAPSNDNWYHIIPKGNFPHPQSKKLQILDGVALNHIKANFDQEAARPNFPGVLVDYEHFSYDTDKESKAAGWLMAVELRNDGIWGNIRWSGQGRKDVESGIYRMLSPTWLPRDVQDMGSDSFRPLRLDSVGLTNTPNLRGMTPLSNRDTNQPKSSEPNDRSESMNAVIQSNDIMEVERTRLKIENLTEEQKADECHRLAAAYKNRTGALWEDAWAMVCAYNPGLVERSIRINRGPGRDQESADELTRLANHYKNRRSCTFEEAWDAACTDRPDLAKSAVHLGNRALRPGMPDMALPEEVDAQDRLVQIFIDRMIELQAKLGSYKAAYDAIKAETPSVMLGFNVVCNR
jgi:hypothetical protein